MANISRGDRVVAKKDISVGIFTTIKAGTKGVATSDQGILFSTVEVAFEREGEYEVSASSLMRI